MSVVNHPSTATETSVEIPLQPASADIWERKYQLKTAGGEAVDKSIDDTYARVARALADIETTPEKRRNGTGNFCGR